MIEQKLIKALREHINDPSVVVSVRRDDEFEDALLTPSQIQVVTAPIGGIPSSATPLIKNSSWMVLVFGTSNVVGIKWNSSCCYELWSGDYYNDNIVAFVNVAIDP